MAEPLQPIQYAQSSRNFQQDYVPTSVKDRNIDSMTVGKLVAGTLDVPVDVGKASTAGAYVRIDGPNNRFIINDGTTNRIVIGNI